MKKTTKRTKGPTIRDLLKRIQVLEERVNALCGVERNPWTKLPRWTETPAPAPAPFRQYPMPGQVAPDPIHVTWTGIDPRFRTYPSDPYGNPVPYC